MSLVCTQADLLLLGKFHGAAAVGLYGVPFRMLALLVTVLPISLMGLMLPQLSRAWFANDMEAYRKLVQGAVDFLSLALLPVVVATLARAEGIVVLIGGAELEGAANILRILILAGALSFFNQLYGHILLSTQGMRRLIAPTALVCALVLLAYFLFIPAYGVWAAAWGRVLHAVLFGIATVAVLEAATRNAPRLGVVARAAVAAAAMWAVLSTVPPVNVVVDLGIGLTAYALAALATGAVRPDQIRGLLATLGRRRPTDEQRDG